MPLSIFAIVDSVMTRTVAPVRRAKSRRVVPTARRGAVPSISGAFLTTARGCASLSLVCKGRV